MLSSTSESPLGDIDYLARSDHRVVGLGALADQPRTRAELRSLTGASASTIGRTLREFERRRWIRRRGDRYEATPLGAFVAAGMQELLDRFETEQRLREIWRWLPPVADGFTVEMVAEATVTAAAAEEPYRPVNRFVALLEETKRLRFVGSDLALLEPCKDELRRHILDGMDTEIIDPPNDAAYILSTYPDHCAVALESGNLSVRVHDDLPSYGISIFDDRIGISGHDRDTGTVKVFVDTDAPAAREWAVAVYRARRIESRPLSGDLVE
ncbi:MarR family transcriptional regulator [Halobacteria archaeon AArc-dxtr1]|nr:MarR family transcriptional regulator [Halobacteria archaeon AArc-dxtr1]